MANYIFLLNEWKEQAYAHIIHERHVYVGHLGECLHFFVEDGVVRYENIDVLGCNHGEADTRICLYAKVIDDVGTLSAFEKAFGPSANAKNHLHKLKGGDASSLPPCEAERRQLTSVCIRGEDVGRCRSAEHRSTSSTRRRMGTIQ